MRQSSKNVCGFSGIEITVVVAIALVLMAVAVPTANTVMTAFRLQSAVNTVTGAIQMTRMQAISTTTPYKLTFTAATNTYQVWYCQAVSGQPCSILAPTGTYVNTMLSSVEPANSTYTGPTTGVPFAGVNSGVVLSANTTFFFRPGGAVQSTEGTTSCPTLAPFTLTYNNVTKTITVGCYGQITVTP